jgi:hypothetical protein
MSVLPRAVVPVTDRQTVLLIHNDGRLRIGTVPLTVPLSGRRTARNIRPGVLAMHVHVEAKH